MRTAILLLSSLAALGQTVSITTPAATNMLPVFRAGQTYGTFTCAIASGSGTPAYFWQDIAYTGTDPLVFSARTSATTTVTARTFGDHNLQCTVVDLTGTHTATVHVGGVGTDAQDVVAGSNADLTTILGEVAMHAGAASPYPWFDVTERATADVLNDGWTHPPTEAIQAGTSSVSATGNIATFDLSGNPIFTGPGGGSCPGIRVVGVGTSFDMSLIGNGIYLHWDSAGDSSYQGRHFAIVCDVTDATHLIINNFNWFEPASKSLTMPWGIPADTNGWHVDTNTGFDNPWTYYDAIEGAYRLYLRTGLTKYQTEARAICNNWWVYAFNQGFYFGIERNMAWDSMLACGMDNHPDWVGDTSKGITLSMLNMSLGNPCYTATSPIDLPNTACDLREMSYMEKGWANLIQVTAPGSLRTTLCGYWDQIFDNFIVPNQLSSGLWQENVGRQNIFAPACGLPCSATTPIYGTSPWRANGLIADMLTYSYPAILNACSDSTRAASLITVLVKTVDGIKNYGRNNLSGLAGGGQFASVNYETNIYNFGQALNGSVDVQNNMTAVLGHGTHFLSELSPGDGAQYIQLSGQVYVPSRVASITDDTHLTLGAGYPGVTINGSGAFRVSGCAGGGCNYPVPFSGVAPGTVAINMSGTTVTGTGTSFLAWFCNGAAGASDRYISLQLASPPNWFAPVSSCASDTVMTVGKPFPYANVNTINYGTTSAASTTTNNSATTAESDVSDPSGRSLSGDIALGPCWLYQFNVITYAAYQADCTYYSGKTYGGSASGPSGSTPFPGSAPYVGPVSDGGVGGMAGILPACSPNVPPCGGGGVTQFHGKPFGMCCGAGGQSTALAYRVGGLLPADPLSQTFKVKFPYTLACADHVALDIIAPSGAVTTTVSSSGSDSVTGIFDRSQGLKQLYKIRYETAGNVNCSNPPFPTPITIQ